MIEVRNTGDFNKMNSLDSFQERKLIPYYKYEKLYELFLS